MKTKETNEWFVAHRVTHKLACFDPQQGKAVIHVDLLDHPEKCIEARVRREDISQNVYLSMKTKGIGRTDIVVLVWQEDLEDWGVDLFSLQLGQIMEKLRLQVICGDHTTSGVIRLHRENKSDPQYFTLPCEVILCNKTQDNIRLAYNMGSLDNDLKSMTTAVTAWDIVVKLHYVHEDVNKKYQNVRTRKEMLDKEYTEIYKGCSSLYTKNTFGSLRVLGSKTGKLWDNIARMFDTPVNKKVGKGQPKPVAPSVGHFYHMADIPEGKLIQWSDRFFKKVEPWNSLMFKKRCDTYKKEQRVKTQVREYVNVIERECEAKNWSDLVEYFPFFGSDMLVDSWVNMMPDLAKSQLIGHIKTSINQAIQAYKLRKASPSKENAVDVRFCFDCQHLCVYCYLTFSMYTIL